MDRCKVQPLPAELYLRRRHTCNFPNKENERFRLTRPQNLARVLSANEGGAKLGEVGQRAAGEEAPGYQRIPPSLGVLSPLAQDRWDICGCGKQRKLFPDGVSELSYMNFTFAALLSFKTY